jgi:hypothetical protein
MTERREYLLKAPEGIEFSQLAYFYRSAGLPADPKALEETYPGMSGFYSWLAIIPERKREKFESILPNFGIEILYSIPVEEKTT